MGNALSEGVFILRVEDTVERQLDVFYGRVKRKGIDGVYHFETERGVGEAL